MHKYAVSWYEHGIMGQAAGRLIKETRTIGGALNTYAKYGVPEYWIIEPYAGTLEQYTLRVNKTIPEIAD